LDRVVAAAGAAVASALITNPMDVVKTRVQTQAAQLNMNAAVLSSSQSMKTVLPRLGLQSSQLTYLSCGCLPGVKLDANANPISINVGVTRGGALCATTGAKECGIFSGTLDAARKIVRKEGFKVLWRGTPAALAMAIPQVGIYMPTYEALKARLTKGATGEDSLMPALVAGTTARGLAVLITSPLERYRTRVQAFATKMPSSSPSPSSLGSLRGFSQLWKGTVATLARDVPFSGIYWVVTESVRRRLSSPVADAKHATEDAGPQGVLRQVAYVNLLSGTVGGVVAASVTTPLDVVKTRIQVDLLQDDRAATAKGQRPAVGFLRKDSGVRQVGGMIRKIATQEGPGRLFDGAAARAARAAPSCAIVLTSYEILKAIIAKF